MIPVSLIPGTLASTCYPPDPQDLYLDIIARTTAQVNTSFSGVIISDTAPGVAYLGYLWFRTTDQQLFSWITSVGAWARRHPVAASSSQRMIWVGSEASLWAYDGGDGNDPSVVTPGDAVGAMWVRDANFNGRFPVGFGPIPGSSPAATITAPGQTQDDQSQAGEYKHTLSIAEMPAHDHGMPTTADMMRTRVPPGTGNNNDDAVSGSQYYNYATFLAQGGGEGHNNMPPYYSVIIAKRSARLYIKA